MSVRSVFVSRKEIVDIWCVEGRKLVLGNISVVENFICGKLLLTKENNHSEWNAVGREVSKVCYKIRNRWQKCNNDSSRFENSHSKWLECQEQFSVTLAVNHKADSKVRVNPHSKPPGRPKKDYAESSDRSKRRKIESLRASCSTEELAYATEMNARAEGNEDGAKLVHEALLTTPTRPSKMRTALREHRKAKPVERLSTDEALSFCIDADLSKSLDLDTQIANLTPTVIEVNPSLTVKIKHNIQCSMVDGKVVSALTGMIFSTLILRIK